MTDSRLTNWLRVRRGLPARNMSDDDLMRRLRRSEAAARAASLELAELVRAARENGLPLPAEPTRIVDGLIVHPTLGVREGHRYLSTACLHAYLDDKPDLHGYCAAQRRPDGTAKTPATCKFCSAPCICACHRGGRPDE